MASDLVRRRVRVSGRVQGVFFRASMRDEADRLGVTGWVANRPGGVVEAEIQGAPDDVAAMVEWAHRGPSQARVADVDVTEAEVDDSAEHFEVIG